MEFKKSKGVWRDTENLGYRITSTKGRYGLPVRYYACVRTADKRWEFAQHRRGYKTIKAAKDACEQNFKLWSAVVKLNEAKGRRDTRLQVLSQRGRKGGGNILFATPRWAAGVVDPVLLRMLEPTKRKKNYDEDE